ncbi:unnamed protein product [Ilex paraguariensis]|uniref:WEB family protein n=2 Tax=Ilex paraguariensis TaxID=185542 RepID=A0ABC8STR0_9AQUA
MAETSESAVPQAETTTEVCEESRKINPRVEIDTSPPFESVKEAVTRFGGSGPWIPLHLLRLAADHASGEFDSDKLEEQAAQLEKDLIVKEQETLDVLKELEEAKKFVEGLKMNWMKEVSALIASPDLSSGSPMSTPNDKSVDSRSLCPAPSPGLILMELNQAKSNLNKTTIDLAVIRASVESLNKKMRKEKIVTEVSSEKRMQNSVEVLPLEENHNRARVTPHKANDAEPTSGPENSTNISTQLQQLNFEAEQIKNMTEAARYEVMKAMAEMERTKTSIHMVEMRLIAAKKMDEAARAVEAVALAERKALSNGKSPSEVFLQKPDGITLSIEEYSVLTQKAQKAEELSNWKKAQKAEELSNWKVVDANANALHHINGANLSKKAILNKLEATNEEIKHSKKSLEEALDNVGGTNRRNLIPEEGFCRRGSEHVETRHSGYSPAKFKFRNSHSSHGHRGSQAPQGEECDLIKDKSMPVFRSTFSIGDILSRKLILRDDIVMGRHIDDHTERRGVSLSQMLREQSSLILNPPKTMRDENVDKEHLAQRKRFGFIHVSFPTTKQSKKKAQGLN